MKFISVSILIRKQKKYENVYNLRLFDKNLMTFSMQANGLEGLAVNIISVDRKNKHILPPGLILSNEGVLRAQAENNSEESCVCSTDTSIDGAQH